MSLFTGQVWQDLNADGIQDPGELALEGLTVYLDLNGNQLLDANEPQRLTDAAGAYSFDNLDNGLYSIRLLSPSNATLILPQTQTPAISLRGLDTDSRGVALWDAFAGAPEPARTGHNIVFNGEVVAEAYYYLASRDYLNPTAPAGIQGQGAISGFTEFAAALDAEGYTAADLTVQFGLASLGADLEGQDWFAEGTRETRLYQGGELTLQLAGQDFLRAAFPTLTTLIDYNDPLNLDDDRLSAWSEGFTLEDNSLGSSPEVQAVAQAFLTDAASQGGLRLVFDSFQSADQLEFNENGREGAVFDAQFGQLGFVEDVGVQEDGYFIVLDGDKTLDSLDFGLAPSYEEYFFTYNYGNGDSYTGVVYELAGTYSAGEIIGGFTNDTGNEGFYTIDSVFGVDSATEGEVFIDGYIDGDIGYGTVNSFFGEGFFGLGSESGTVNDFLGFDFSPLVEGDALEPLSISGNVSEDTTNDGVGDVNLSGVTIELLSAGVVLTSTLTDFDGNYVFTDLAPGTYTVRQANLASYEDVSDSDGGDANEITVTVLDGEFVTNNNFIDEVPFSALDLAQAILGDGVDLVSTSYVGDNRGATVFDNPGLGIEIQSGIVLSTGNVADIVGPNENDSTGTNFSTSGDADLDNLVSPNTTNDAAVLEFSFVPTEAFLSFNYIFASEEYNEFVDSSFNDVFGFFLIDSLGNQQDLAVLPETDIPITVNNINGSVNSSFYRNNDPGDFGFGLTPFNTQFDGLTTALTAVANVTPGETYTLKLAIADTSDSIYDSAVFLSNNSLSSTSLVAVNDATTLSTDSSTAINVLVNDLVPTNGSPQILSFQTLSDQGGIIALDDNGTTETSSDDQLVYTAPTGFAGTDTFTYTLGDGSGASDTAQVSLQVEAPLSSGGVTLSAELIQVSEGGATATYTVVLDSAPTADVTVTLNPGNQLTVDQTVLTFTPANFNIPQTVTVGAVDDPIGEGPHQRVITATVTSSDANYDGITVANVAAQITDNDIPGDPTFQAPQTNPFGLSSVVYSATPIFADIDGDGDFDAFVGDDTGNTLFFENTGTSSSPAFGTSQTNPFGLTNVGSYSAPTLADIDGDGDLDAFIGKDIGDTLFFENTGTSSSPAFGTSQTNPFGLSNIGSFAAPTLADIDGDGDLDAFVGNGDGNTLFFDNTGGAGSPAFAAPTFNPFGLSNVGFSALPTLADIDGDGDLDTFIGNSAGNTLFFENTGSTSSPAFGTSQTNPFGPTEVGFNAAPTFSDIDGDGDLDAFIGNYVGNTLFFLNEAPLSSGSVILSAELIQVAEGGATATYTVVLDSAPTADVTVTLNPGNQLTVDQTVLTFTPANFNIPQTVTVGAVDDPIGEGPHQRVITATVTSSDTNYDGITVANVAAQITDNDIPGDPNFQAPQTNPFGLDNVGSSAAPTFVDIDGDGDLDAFVGERYGSVLFYQNTGSASSPSFGTSQTNPFGLTNVGFYAAPTLVDIDGDGDLDAFVGNSAGNTLFFENTASASTPAFSAPETNPFGLTTNANVGYRATPTFVDIDDDGDLDAFVGEGYGNTLFFENTGSASTPAFGISQSNPFGLTSLGFTVKQAFVDIDGDGDLDAFVGNSTGNTLFFENTGSTSSPAFAAPVTNAFELIDVGSGSAPTFEDIDGDGDLDAFVGNDDGNTLFFLNEAPGVGATISGAVLKDLDGDGVGDLGIGAVQVELFDALGSGPLAVTFTDAVGNYSFFLPSGQDSGSYIVRQTNLAGYEDVSDSDGGDPNEITIVVEPNGAYSGNDFIDQLIPSALQIQLNLLTDNGGAPGELISANQITAGQTFFVEILAADLRDNAQGIIGLELDLAWDGLLLEAINFEPTTAITSSFTVLREGTLDNGLGTLSGLVGASAPEFGEGAAIGVNQLERFALLQFQAEAVSGGPQNLTTTLVSAALADDGTFTPEVETEQPFEILPPPTGTISGAVLADTDNDGIGDEGIADVTVGLLLNGSIIASQTTDELGNYLFVDFEPGVYVVQQINLTGYSDVSDSDGGDPNEITVTLAPGQINSGNNFTDELIPIYEEYLFTYIYPADNTTPGADTYTGSVYALEGTYTPGQVVTLSGVPGTYTIGDILSTTTDSALEGVVTLTAYTDASTGFGTTANVSGAGSGGLGSESGLVIATPFNPLQEADLGFGAITITDNSGDSADQSIRFTTPLSQFRSNYADSDLVRPNGPDTGKYFDILNSGDGILRVTGIEVNAPGVIHDLNFSGGDILLNPGASQRVNLTYTPDQPTLSGALTVFSDAQNNPAIGVILAGRSTFDSDINYDGIVNISDLGALNQAKFQEILGNFDPTADINGDGALTTQDIFSWLAEL